MAYACRIERDSISPRSHRLTTAVITYPREVLAEVVTHRLLQDEGGCELWYERTTPQDISKNSASSRAIPVARMLKTVEEDPWIPQHWGKSEAGMEARATLDESEQDCAIKVWLVARDNATESARQLLALGLHKQVVNRLLEPFSWVTQVITATDDGWANFFALRTHSAAAPAFRTIARALCLAYLDSTPAFLEYGNWHLPFVYPEDDALAYSVGAQWQAEMVPLPDYVQSHSQLFKIKLSAGRTARVSYLTHDGRRDYQDDLKLHDRLVVQEPVHASPTEHQGTPLHVLHESSRKDLRSNLTGFVQYRKLVPKERANVFTPTKEQVSEWRKEVGWILAKV